VVGIALGIPKLNTFVTLIGAGYNLAFNSVDSSVPQDTRTLLAEVL